MALKVKKKSLADRINALITTRPASFGSDDEAEETRAKVVEQYDEDAESAEEFRESKIRRQNVGTLDETDSRYAGKKVSRKDIYNDSNSDQSDDGSEDNKSDEDAEDEEMDVEDEEAQDDDEDENDLLDGGDSNLSDEDISADKDEGDSEDQSDEFSDDDEDEEYGVDIGNPLYRKRDDSASNFKTMTDTNVKADIDKGNCVRNQLRLWENLLEMRIKLQKCLATSNQMPQYDVHKNYRADSEFATKTNEATNKLTTLLSNLLDLQNKLLKQYPETKDIGTSNKKRKAGEVDNEEEEEADSMDEEIPSDTEDEIEEGAGVEEEKEVKKVKEETPRKKIKLSEYGKLLEENHRMYRSYRDTVIQKWNEKTRIATGSIDKGMAQTSLKQIEFALSDKSKVRKRTQLKRSEYKIVGKPEAAEDEDGRRVQEYDSEIYDDDDFYHQLLRDLIEYKSSDCTDPIQLSKQWIQLQNMRSKMKRKIDTRATKGRRIRFNVHNKLVNFMAPITVNDTWTDLAKNELYNSLFGKIKPVEEVAR